MSQGHPTADHSRPQSTKALAVGERPPNPDRDAVRSMYLTALARAHLRSEEFLRKVLALGSKPE